MVPSRRRRRQEDRLADRIHGPRPRHQHLLVPHRSARADGDLRGAVRVIRPTREVDDELDAATLSPPFPSLVRDFFLRYLTAEKGVSPRTVEAYRDALRLLFAFTARALKKQPDDLTVADLDAPVILRFLESLEKDRGNSARTRNARLAAIKSFLRYAGSRDLAVLPVVQRSLAIPTKRYDQPLLGFLSRSEVDALLDVCVRSTWSGERDYVLLSLAYNTGARVSESAVGLTIADIDLARTMSVRILGKGRKLRQVPLWKANAVLLGRWIERLHKSGDYPVFPNRWGGRSAVPAWKNGSVRS